MRKIIFLLFIAATVLSQSLVAQQTAYNFEPEKMFNQGKELFLAENFVGAQDLLSRFLIDSDDNILKDEARYMLAVSSFKRGEERSVDVLQSFWHQNPKSIYKNQIAFLMGSWYFDKKEWKEAEYWFGESDLDYLSNSDQENYSFRIAYTNMQLGNNEEAARLFGLLAQNSKTHRDAADFYYGYIDYKNGNYQSALSRFQRLSNHPDYSEEVAFYTAQAAYFDDRQDEGINLAEAFIGRYPNSQHTAEVNRILGNSYYRMGMSSKALSYYERYMAGSDNLLRGDAYYIGQSYREAGKYDDAIKMFQQATGERDELSQNAQLQLGYSFLKLNRKQDAQMAFEAATRDNFNPQVRETAMFNYALIAHETNFSVFSESITLFENFLKEYPSSQYTNQVNDILAETFLTTKDYDAALSAINRIKNPGNRILEAKQMILFQLGAQDFINGDMNKAVQQFNNSIGLGNYNSKARSSAYYWRGEAYYRMGNYNNAALDFQQFTKSANSSDENYALGWYNLGYSRFKQQQYSQAVGAFREYISLEADKNRSEYADALNRIGDSYYFNRSFSEAEVYYSQASDVNPASADYAAYQKAFVMGLQRNYQGKINALDNLMSRFPNSQYYDDALYEKSRAQTMLGIEGEAISTLHRLVSEFPRSPLASQGGVQLGQLYYNNDQYQQSISAYKSVISNFPGSDDARNALISLETVYRDINDIDSYVSYANSLPGGLRITPSRQDSLTYLAAEGQYMKGSKSDAEMALNKYLQTFPNGAYSSDANYHLGVMADEKGNTQQAQVHFRRVVDASSIKYLDNALTYTAKAEYEAGNYRQALADYSRLAATARSTSSKQAGLLGVVRTQTKLESFHEAARAATDLLETSNLSPETVTEVRYLRGKAYQQAREVESAMADFKSIANDTRSKYGAEAQFIIADTYYKWQSFDKAEEQVKEFMKLGTPHQYWMARALIVLSDTYKAKGDSFQARQYLESLQSNYTGDEADIRQMINERLN